MAATGREKKERAFVSARMHLPSQRHAPRRVFVDPEDSGVGRVVRDGRVWMRSFSMDCTHAGARTRELPRARQPPNLVRHPYTWLAPFEIADRLGGQTLG